MKFEIYKAADGWRWRLKSRNGEIIASGEAYQNRLDCLGCIELIKQLAKFAPVENEVLP